MEAQTRSSAAQIEADRARLLADSPQTQWLRDMASRGSQWIDKKDFSQAPPGMFNYNLADPAKRGKQREAELNLQPTGAMALGMQNANPTALAMAKLKLNSEMDQDNAANYEGSVGNYMQEIKGMNSDLANFDFTRNNALLGNAMNRWQSASSQWGQTANARASVVPSILGGVLGAAGTVAGAYYGRK